MGEAPRTIDYVFTTLSPWAYIGHARFGEICRRHAAVVRHRPVALSAVFPESGGLPLAKRHPLRQSYRLVELQRWRECRGLGFNLHPRFWPFDATLADRVVLALIATGADPESFVPRAFAAVWEGERDLADPATLEALLSAGGHDAAAVMAAARSEPMAEAYGRATPWRRGCSVHPPTSSTARSSGGRTVSTCSTPRWRAAGLPTEPDRSPTTGVRPHRRAATAVRSSRGGRSVPRASADAGPPWRLRHLSRARHPPCAAAPAKVDRPVEADPARRGHSAAMAA